MALKTNPNPNPLHDLTQVIHVDAHKILFHSTVTGKSGKEKWDLWLFVLGTESGESAGEEEVLAWHVRLDLKEVRKMCTPL